MHGEIYKRRGLLTSEGREIKNKSEILALLKALFLPTRLSIIHCLGHQRGDSMVARGNRLADETAKQAALGPQLLTIRTGAPGQDAEEPDIYHYTDLDLDNIQALGAQYDDHSHVWVYQKKAVLPLKKAEKLLSSLHSLTHLSAKKMSALLDRGETDYYIPNKNALIRQVTERCKACAQVNAGKYTGQRGICLRGHRPGVHWEVDFTEIKPGIYNNKYLLVFIDTFSG